MTSPRIKTVGALPPHQKPIDKECSHCHDPNRSCVMLSQMPTCAKLHLTRELDSFWLVCKPKARIEKIFMVPVINNLENWNCRVNVYEMTKCTNSQKLRHAEIFSVSCKFYLGLVSIILWRVKMSEIPPDQIFRSFTFTDFPMILTFLVTVRLTVLVISEVQWIERVDNYDS